jgi:7-cyano-7-deazaguanine synthase
MNLQLSGGGLDSIALFLYLVRYGIDFQVLHLQYGQKAFYGERSAVEFWCRKHKVELFESKTQLDFSFSNSSLLWGNETSIGDSPEAIEGNKLECRNVVLLSMGLAIVASHGGGTVYIAFHKEPHPPPFPDASENFRQFFGSGVKHSTRETIEIKAPFARMDREEIFNYGYSIGKQEYIDRSFTCYEGIGGRECGECSHCLLKKEFVRRLKDVPM